MPHLHRFYVPFETPVGDTIILPPDEAHHALHVVRLKVGEAVALFDGIGREWTGKVAEAGRKDVSIRIEEAMETPPPSKHLTLALAWLNHPRQIEEIIRRGTELGVMEFIFFRGAHSEREPKRSEKWQRILIEVCKQTGRLWLPEIQVLPDIQTVIANARPPVLIASLDVQTVPLRQVLAGHEQATLLIGPEGDFSHEELAAALEHDALPISLGEYTLRSEIAAATGCTLIKYEWGELGDLG